MLLFVIFVGIMPQIARTQSVRRTITITQLHPIAAVRPASPKHINLTRIYVNNGKWGNTDCRQDAADLRKEDSHLMAILLAAWLNSKSITIEVDSSLRPADTVCQVTALFVK